MNKKELDAMVPIDDNRIARVARGSGVHPAEIKGLMAQYE
jgi:signal recognition particle GTPase